MELLPPVKDAVARLYETFQIYPLDRKMEACPCCHEPDVGEVLLSKKLVELTAQDLSQYANDALQLWGGTEDFKHFLPRTFEILAECELEWPWRATAFVDAEIVISKLRHGAWEKWPTHERAAVREFLHAMWRALIASEPTAEDEPKVGEWLCVLSQAETDLSPYFTEWLQDGSPAANVNLARTLLTGAWTPQWNPFWGEEQAQAQLRQVEEWIKGSLVREKLARAYERWPNEPFSEDLFSAAAML
jgi:hypothetical protein